jgi:hypothetical protein
MPVLQAVLPSAAVVAEARLFLVKVVKAVLPPALRYLRGVMVQAVGVVAVVFKPAAPVQMGFCW